MVRRKDDCFRGNKSSDTRSRNSEIPCREKRPRISFTALIVTNEELYNRIKDQRYLRRPRPIKHPSNREVDKLKFCIFHKYYGHVMNNCDAFQYQLEMELKKGNLTKYIKGKAREVNTTNQAAGRSMSSLLK